MPASSSQSTSFPSPVAITLAQPSSTRRRSSPTTPQVRRNRYSGMSSAVSMPSADRRRRSWSSIPARCSMNAVYPGRGGVVERAEVDQVEPPSCLGRPFRRRERRGRPTGRRRGRGGRCRAARSRGCRRRSARGSPRGPSVPGSGPGCPGHRSRCSLSLVMSSISNAVVGVIADGVADCPDQVVQGGGVRVAVDVEDRLAKCLGRRLDREQAVGDRHEQVTGPGDGPRAEAAGRTYSHRSSNSAADWQAVSVLPWNPPPLIVSPSQVPGANLTALFCSRPFIRSETFLLIGVSWSGRIQWVAVRCRSCSARRRGLSCRYSAIVSRGAGVNVPRAARRRCSSLPTGSGRAAARPAGTGRPGCPRPAARPVIARAPRRLRAARTRCVPGNRPPARRRLRGDGDGLLAAAPPFGVECLLRGAGPFRPAQRRDHRIRRAFPPRSRVTGIVRAVGGGRTGLGGLAGVLDTLGPGQTRRPLADREPGPDQVQQDGQQLSVRFRLQPAGPGLAQQVADPGVPERGRVPAGRQPRPGQRMPGMGDRVLEVDRPPVTGITADDPLALVPAAPGRTGPAVVPQHLRVVIPEPADLHAAAFVGCPRSGRAAARRTAPARGSPAPTRPARTTPRTGSSGCGCRPGPRTRACSASRRRCQTETAQVAIVCSSSSTVRTASPSGSDPRSATSISGIAGQELEQQPPDDPECPLASSLVSWPQDPHRQNVAAGHSLYFHEMVVPVDTAVVRGDSLRREEREPGDPVAGELRHDRGRKAG